LKCVYVYFCRIIKIYSNIVGLVLAMLELNLSWLSGEFKNVSSLTYYVFQMGQNGLNVLSGFELGLLSTDGITVMYPEHFLKIPFLDATWHLYKPLCLPIRPSICADDLSTFCPSFNKCESDYWEKLELFKKTIQSL